MPGFSIMFSDRVETRATPPSWDRIERDWEHYAESVRERWGHLTDNDIAVIDGDRRLLVGKIQERYGIITDQAERQVEDWLQETSRTDHH